jgi:hypothetical protein
MFDYSLLFFSFVGGQISLPRDCTGLCSQEWIGEFCVVCGVHLFILPIDVQADLEQAAAAGKNGTHFSQYSMVWGSFPRARGSGCCRV